MKYLYTMLVLAVLALVTPSFAQQQDSIQVDVTKLTSDQLRVYQQLKTMENSSKTVMAIQNLTPERIDQYAQIGKAFGTAFKECWTTVSNDAEKFAQSSAGKWAMVLVSWKIMGEDAIGLARTTMQWIVGGALFIFGIPFWIWLIKRNCVNRPIQVIEKTGFWTKKIVYSERSDPIHADVTVAYGACFLVYLAVTSAIMFIH